MFRKLVWTTSAFVLFVAFACAGCTPTPQAKLNDDAMQTAQQQAKVYGNGQQPDKGEAKLVK